MKDDDERSTSKLRQVLHNLEQDCKDVDPNTLFFGPRKHIQDLWLIIHQQKQYIQTLENLLGISRELPERTTKAIGEKSTHIVSRALSARVIGNVLGHELRVVQKLQQQLQNQHIVLGLEANPTNQPADITLLFHRKKARLPQDEIHFMLEKASAQGPPGQVIVVFMHNIASGHEKSLFKAVGPNDTDLGCWSAFAQKCLLVTDMTFDEARYDWNAINAPALQLIVEAISNTAQQTSSHDRHPNQKGI